MLRINNTQWLISIPDSKRMRNAALPHRGVAEVNSRMSATRLDTTERSIMEKSIKSRPVMEGLDGVR